MKVVVKFFKKSFKGAISKHAYLRAMKWVAQHVASKQSELGDVLIHITKQQDENQNLHQWNVELYGMYDDNNFVKSRCAACQQFHSSFFINQQFNCDRCNMASYRKAVDVSLNVKKKYKQSILSRIIEKIHQPE